MEYLSIGLKLFLCSLFVLGQGRGILFSNIANRFPQAWIFLLLVIGLVHLYSLGKPRQGFWKSVRKACSFVGLLIWSASVVDSIQSGSLIIIALLGIPIIGLIISVLRRDDL
jgi:hypothetical protein